jgi:hypothetical protein
MTRIRLPRRWAQAAVLFAAAGIGPSIALADPYGYESRGYCTVDSCGSCDNETWWDRTCGFCRERTDHFRSLRRKWYWKNNDRHITTMYPETSPFCSPTYGYFQTCWRPFPYECPRCPQYVISPASAPSAIPSSAPPMELAPATDAAQPGVAPGAKEPYFPQPAVPPASESPLPPAPPEMFEGDVDAALPLGFRSLPPVQEVFTNDGWMPHGLRPVHTASFGFVSED